MLPGRASASEPRSAKSFKAEIAVENDKLRQTIALLNGRLGALGNAERRCGRLKVRHRESEQ